MNKIKERLFEVMSVVDKTFKPKLYENTPSWAVKNEPQYEFLYHITNEDDGTEGRIILGGSNRGKYNAVFWDTDGNEAIAIQLYNDIEKAKEWLNSVVFPSIKENQNFFDDEPSIADKIYQRKLPQIIKASYESDVLLNPKYLKGVETGVRAIGDINGNLYVLEKDVEFTHVSLGQKLGFDIWNNPKYIRLIRGKGNNFYLSDDLTEHDYHKVLDALRIAHPRFKFHDETFDYRKHWGWK